MQRESKILGGDDNHLWQQPAESTHHPWRNGLPGCWLEKVVQPSGFEIQREYEVAAARVLGHDANDIPCFCAYSYALTQLCCEDDDVLYEIVVYAEERVGWRLTDGRWLIRHAVSATEDCDHSRSWLTLSDAMPH